MFAINVRELVSKYMPYSVVDSSKIDAGAVVEVCWTLFSALLPFYVSAGDIEQEADFFWSCCPPSRHTSTGDNRPKR
jgi:hypothetical protein